MKGLVQFRAKAGLSQRELAGLLDIPKSTLHYAEREGRALPTSALLKLGALEIERHSKIARYPSPCEAWMEKEKEGLQKLIDAHQNLKSGLDVKIGRNKRKLARMNRRFQRCMRSVQTNSSARAISKHTEAEEDWEATHLNAMKDCFRENSPLKQIELKMEIERMEGEREVVEKQLDHLLSEDEVWRVVSSE